MDVLTATAASGMRARSESLDMLANNLANAGVAGFKADREFYSTYFAPEALNGPAETYPAFAPLIDDAWVDHAEGPAIPTNNMLDFRISGRGYFVVQSPQGNLYTRDGHFRLSAGGVLETSQGMAVLGQDQQPIRLRPGENFSTDSSGEIQQGGGVVGRFQVVDFDNLRSLRKAGTSYFRWEGKNTPPPVPATITQGQVEGANFQPAEASVRLVDVMRQFEMLQRALSLGSEMNRRSIEDVARI